MPDRRIAEIQINPVQHACRHAVQFYEHDSALIEALGQHIGTALDSGDTAIVMATKAHLNGLAEELHLRKIDASAAIKDGLFIKWHAAKALAKFMVGGGPDKQKFQETVGALVSQAAARTKPGHRLVAFGEMVALLWAEGKRDATVRLEELWNELAEQHTFDLLCGYPIGVFDRLEHRQLFFSICGEHIEVNAAESYLIRVSDIHRRSSATKLQQTANALDT